MPRTVAFTKGQGTGNDFVILTDPDNELELSDDQVRVLCDRRFGIGADGILRVVRTAAVRASAPTGAADAEWFMDYRNADGSIAEMCGNGVRVFAHYLVRAGLSESTEQRIATRAGVKTVRPSDDGYEVDMGGWRFDRSEVRVRARGLDVARPGLGVDVGNPHVVVALADDEELDRLDLGPQPLIDPAPASGANIEFVVPGDPLVVGGIGSMRMRVFERGVGETLSCGTGVVAAALAVREWAGPAAPDRWSVEVPGGILGVRVSGESVLLSGPAALVFSGEIALA